MKLPISLVVLTYNEELNLARCLESAKEYIEEIIVVDCGSTDNTVEIARVHGAEVVVHPFTNQAAQFNWALDNVPIKGEWILRLDADEAMTKELWGDIEKAFENTGNISGFYMKRQVHFMGRFIRHGGYYPTWFLRLWRKGKGRFEEREMDEHIILRGRAGHFSHDIVEADKKDLHTWIEKHNRYATREATAYFKKDTETLRPSLQGEEPERVRWYKENFYYRLPPFFRAFAYFFYRYILRLGFLDGREGLIFHFLQGFWYRFLVDAKICEQKIKRT